MRMSEFPAMANGVPPAVPAPGDAELIEELSRARGRIAAEIAKRVVGQEEVIEQLLIALFSRGHCLFVGVPGLAKTLLISTLADEINRTPPKTQAALLQAMQEHRVTAGGRTYPLEEPFLVFATQNPIEQEGTYPLPEAQLDRFMFMVDVSYPSAEEEVQIVRATTSGAQPSLQKVLAPEQIRSLQDLVLRVPAADHVIRYAVDLVRRTRPGESADRQVKDHVAWGAGPRASQALIVGAKARAALDARPAATVDDVRALAEPVLRHRVLTNFHAEAEGVDSRAVVAQLLRDARA